MSHDEGRFGVEKRLSFDALPVLDGHNDALLGLRQGGRDFYVQDETGHIDMPRLLKGGFAGGFFACFSPNPEDQWDTMSSLIMTDGGYEVAMAPSLDASYARQRADLLVSDLFCIEARSEGRLKVVRTVKELSRCVNEGIITAVLHFEGAENLGPEPGALEELYEVGLRSLGLVWSRPNAYGIGVPFRFPNSPDTGAGLTEAGRELVHECTRLGILIDLSHINERGF